MNHYPSSGRPTPERPSSDEPTAAASPRAQVLLLAGASGSGKSTLVERLRHQHPRVTVVQLDDFYRVADDPGLPAWGGIVDWDHPGSWDADSAHDALRQLCTLGRCEVPVYDIPTSSITGSRPLVLHPGGGVVVAEGLFAPELVTRLRRSGLLLDAVHLRSYPPVTFVRRLARDLAGHRKPPLTLLRRGVALARKEPGLLRRWSALGTRPTTRAEVVALVSAHLAEADAQV